MDFLLLTLSLLVAILGLGLFANRARDKKDIPFELKPNCLLTRWPVLFLTGPRSFFYFARYWNIYPVFLAEHGYEVFTLHLPWNKKNYRKKRLQEFLTEQERHKRHFHLVMDSASLSEFESFLRDFRPQSVASISELANSSAPETLTGLSPFPLPFARIEMQKCKKAWGPLAWSFDLHRWLCHSHNLPELSTLGALDESALKNSHLLLSRMQSLAEADIKEG